MTKLTSLSHISCTSRPWSIEEDHSLVYAIALRGGHDWDQVMTERTPDPEDEEGQFDD
ncbi:BQ2448_7544 [Microbotryum intermedium]|uniref:BQ2448_7544 protein n=1 Tax=Microbotryum intermedium TaxID=269621 RepID=A0A238FMX3_9BASI|nr:BQ2448_7544 [Microbotryum intermedium]